jgi:hypothetical protein
MSYGGREVQ